MREASFPLQKYDCSLRTTINETCCSHRSDSYLNPKQKK